MSDDRLATECVCGEINTRHCSVHGQGEILQTQFAVSGRTRKPRYVAWRVTFLCGHDWSNEHPIPRHDMSKPPIKCPACGCDELVAARGFTR